LIREQLENVSEGIDLISETIVGWNLDWLWLTRLRVLNSSEIEELIVLLLIELLSELVNSSDSELATKGIDCSLGFDFITSQIIVSNEILTWLVDCKALRKFLSL
jgi:hypothetical protein